MRLQDLEGALAFISATESTRASREFNEMPQGTPVAI